VFNTFTSIDFQLIYISIDFQLILARMEKGYASKKLSKHDKAAKIFILKSIAILRLDKHLAQLYLVDPS